MAVIDVSMPESFQFLFSPVRYKVAYGGRGSGKSWQFARALLILGTQRKLRVLCAREQQNSIQESVHKLLKDQIEALGLGRHYEVLQSVITGPHGTTFNFEGIKLNVQKIKSYEAIDVCWVEEANLVSKNSWDVLIPTIRSPGSEIWISFNPEREEDETYKRFVLKPPPSSVVRKITWRDNPYFPKELREEMEYCAKENYDDYLWIWEGNTRKILDGAVYKDEIRKALLEDRVTTVPIERAFPVEVVFDLGRSDNTAIWFKQYVGFQHRFVDFYQNNRKDISHYIEAVKGRGYNLGTIWLPHDAKSEVLGAKLSIEGQVRSAFKGMAKVRVLPRWKKLDGIAAARSIFSNSWFDKEKCTEGWKALTEYKYELFPGTQTFNTKKLHHDEFSDAADGFRYCGMAHQMPKQETQEELDPGGVRQVESKLRRFFSSGSSGTGWMR